MLINFIRGNNQSEACFLLKMSFEHNDPIKLSFLNFVLVVLNVCTKNGVNCSNHVYSMMNDNIYSKGCAVMFGKCVLNTMSPKIMNLIVCHRQQKLCLVLSIEDKEIYRST